MKITIRKLKALHACTEAVEWAEKHFPEGAELTPEVLAQCENDDWICSLACKLSKLYRFWCAGIAFREAARTHLFLAGFSMNVNESNWREAWAVAHAVAPYAAAAAYVAAHVRLNPVPYAAAAARIAVYPEMREEATRILCAL